MPVSLRKTIPALLMAVALGMPGQASAMKKNTPPPQDPPPPAASSSSSSSSASSSTRSGQAPVRRQELSNTSGLAAGDRQRREAQERANAAAEEMERQGRLLRGDYTNRRTRGLSSAERAQRFPVGASPASGSSFFDEAFLRQLAEYRQQEAIIAGLQRRTAITRGDTEVLQGALARQAQLANGLARNGITLAPTPDQENAIRRLIAADGDFDKLQAADRTLVDRYVAENLGNTDHWREKFRGTIVDQKRGEDEQARETVARTSQSRETVQARNARFDQQLRGESSSAVASTSSTSQSVYDTLPEAPVTIEDDYGNLPPPENQRPAGDDYGSLVDDSNGDGSSRTSNNNNDDDGSGGEEDRTSRRK